MIKSKQFSPKIQILNLLLIEFIISNMPNTITISKHNLYIIGTGIILVLAILIFLILKPSSNGINSNSISGLQTNSSSNSNNSGSIVSAEKIVIPENYPQILVKRKTNPELTINLVAGVKKGNFVLLRSNGSVKYFDSKEGVLNVGNKQVIHRIPEAYSDFSIKIYELKSPKLDEKGEFFKWSQFSNSEYYDYKFSSTNDIINENVIWFYSPVDSKLIATSDYNKYRSRGVYIYTKSSKEIQSTFIKDLEKKLDFKIYDKPCEWVSFINNDFICQTTQHQLVNLTTKQTFGGMGEIVEVVEDNDNNIYYRNDLNQVFKANLSNVGSPTKIFEYPEHFQFLKLLGQIKMNYC